MALPSFAVSPVAQPSKYNCMVFSINCLSVGAFWQNAGKAVSKATSRVVVFN